MFCTGCGKEISNDAIRCPVCGKELKSSGINLSDFNFSFSDMKKFANGKEIEQKAQEERNVSSLSEIIADSNEIQIDVLGKGYLANMLHGGKLGNGFGILTDKRFYFKGRCFTKASKAHRTVEKEYAVDLEDIKVTGFVYTKIDWLRSFAKFCFIAGVPLLLAGGFGLILWLLGAILMLIYKVTLRNYYEISFTGGSVCVDASKYGGMKEVREFNKQLRIAKDKAKQL